MSSIVRSQIRRRVRAYQEVHGHRPHSICMTELKFMHLLVDMLLVHPDGEARRIAAIVEREGAAAAAKRVMYMNMHLTIMTQTYADEVEGDDIIAVHRITKYTSFDAAKKKITIDQAKNDSIFGSVFGPGGLFEKVFGREQ